MDAFLQGQIPHKVDPFFRLHRRPDQEEIIDSCRDRETRWDQQQPCTLAGRDKLREVSWHGRATLACKRRASSALRVTKSSGDGITTSKSRSVNRSCRPVAYEPNSRISCTSGSAPSCWTRLSRSCASAWA